MTMPKLMLKPLRSGYGFNLGRKTITTETIEGMPRQRLDRIGTTHKLQATYKCTRPMYQYLMAFLRAYEARPFLAYLLLDDIDHHWYESVITDDSIAVTTLGDQIFTVKLSLIVKPKQIDPELDINTAEVYELSDGKMDEFFNLLEKLVNESLPNATNGLL